MSRQLTITAGERRGVPTLRAAGPLDSTTHTVLGEHIAAIRARKPRALILDLADVDYMSSAGARVILAAHRALKAAGGVLALTNLQPPVRMVFEIIMALPSLNVFDDPAELDRYLQRLPQAP